MSTLWHYTCEHSAAKIGASGTLIAAIQQLDEVPALPIDALPLLGMVWATDMDPPDNQALGLTSRTIACDRTEVRYRVPGRSFQHWGRVRGRLPIPLVDALELAHGAQPARWWVSLVSVPGARRDSTYRQE
jgi:hypothetical protein